MRKLCTLIACHFLLVGCASQNNIRNYSELGYQALQEGNLNGAENFLKDGIGKGQDPRRNWHNLGVVYERQAARMVNKKDALESAIYAFDMGARYGNPLSQQALIKYKRPVPPADLAHLIQPRSTESTQQSNTDAGAALLLGIVGAGVNGWTEGKRDANKRLEAEIYSQPRPVNCYTMALGKDYMTDCR